jgi:hypothetical protein
MTDPIKDYLAEIGKRGGQKSKGGGRPPKYKTEEERREARRKYQREWQRKNKKKS